MVEQQLDYTFIVSWIEQNTLRIDYKGKKYLKVYVWVNAPDGSCEVMTYGDLDCPKSSLIHIQSLQQVGIYTVRILDVRNFKVLHEGTFTRHKGS